VAKDIALTMEDLREVAAFAAESATDVLEIFERANPSDRRPREAIDTAWIFARGGRRTQKLRIAALAALKSARETQGQAAGQSARAAMCASSAAYLHPLLRSTQVRHILGAAAHAARATELAAGDASGVGAAFVERVWRRATPGVVAVLNRFPPAPPGGGRVGELLRSLDAALRSQADGVQQALRPAVGSGVTKPSP
jgi:hypothetical protein